MHPPLQVTFRNISHSDAIEAYVRERAAKLETFHPRITGCHVTIETPHRHQRTGRTVRVLLDVVIPGGEVVVSHAPDASLANKDVNAAIDHAFDQMARRLEDRIRRQRGDVKAREPAYRDGRVAKLWSYEGYGFLKTPDGDEVYFHKNSVLHHGFGRLAVGAPVRFVEEPGEKGPQASTVAVVG